MNMRMTGLRDTRPVEPAGPERRVNLHTSPEIMAGVYANFANVSHSDYEFTLTFSRVDHEVEDDEVPGVVVTRVSLSPQAMHELMDAMDDNWSKWRTTEASSAFPRSGTGRTTRSGEGLADPLHRGRVRAEDDLLP